MTRFLRSCPSLLWFTVATIIASEPVATAMTNEPLKVWDYSAGAASPGFYAVPGIKASFRISPTVKTPDGQPVAEFTLRALKTKRAAWDIQLGYVYEGELKAGGDYEISFLCKGAVPGAVQLAVAHAVAPWTPVPGATAAFNVTTDWQPVVMTFTVQQDWAAPLHVPRFMLADCGETATLQLGPVSLRELPKLRPFALNQEWQLFLNVTAPASLGVLPKELPGPQGMVKAQRVELKNHTLDLAQLAGGVKELACAVLYNQFDSPVAGRMRLGLSADWWMAVYAGGDKVFDNFPGGNDSHLFTPDDHVVEIPVKVGRNLLAVKVLSGSAGWRFVCGASSRAPDEFTGINLGGLFTVRQNANWKPVEMDKLTVKPGTALDFSNLAGERRPAGELGRVIVNPAGRLAFAKLPDRPVRFFGFNTGFGCNEQWTKETAREYAGAMARQGYNAIRLQFIEHNLIGAYQLTGGDFKQAFQQETIVFDAAGVDIFDYFLSCLKERGIYFNLDLLDGATGYSQVPAWTDLGAQGFKTQLLFNPAYRKHWEMAVRQLMNHRNPYTGICLKDEPALLAVEPFNEQDILLSQPEIMAAFTPAFSQYLKNKYQTDAALRQAWRQTDLSFASVPAINEELLRKGDARANDAGHFLIKTMSDANDWYYQTLRDIGYAGIITQWDMIMRTMELPVRAMMPVIAQHSYCTHPNGVPTKNLVQKSDNNVYCWGGKAYDIIFNHPSSLNSSYLRAAAAIRFLDRPFMMTEYAQGFCGRYRHERGLYFGAYAALQGWDALHCHGRPVVAPDAVPNMKKLPPIHFEDGKDPISRASEVVVALAWLRGDVREAPHAVQLTLTDKAMFPKHFLAAIGDDYAKLSMLTKIGVAYPEVKPLAPVGQVKPDLIFTPTEFSLLNVMAWYVSADEKDGEIFPSLLQKLKAAKILSATNRTDYAQRFFQSETGEIALDGKTETMAVITPRLEGAIIKRDTVVKLANLEILSCSKPAAVTVAALDQDKGIAVAKRLLLVFSTNALNNGMTFENSSMQLMVEIGGYPVMMETAKLAISLKSSQGVAPIVYALNLDGRQAEQVPCEFKDGRLALKLDTGKLKYATPFFEIIFP